jgi:hypothetical protein
MPHVNQFVIPSLITDLYPCNLKTIFNCPPGNIGLDLTLIQLIIHFIDAIIFELVELCQDLDSCYKTGFSISE